MVAVRGYEKQDGTQVRAHSRSAPGAGRQLGVLAAVVAAVFAFSGGDGGGGSGEGANGGSHGDAKADRAGEGAGADGKFGPADGSGPGGGAPVVRITFPDAPAGEADR